MSYQVELIEGKQRELLFSDESKLISVCAYCRVSTDKRDQRNSLKAQTRFFESEFSKHSNWTGRDIFYDNGISGTSLKKRDGFNRMVAAALRGEYQLIITKDVSRFSRNVENAMNVIGELQRKGIYIIFLSDDINTQNPEDRERLTEAIQHAETESLKLSRKVRWGQKESMVSGVVFGRKEMYGYSIVRDEVTGEQRFVIIPEEAEIVRRVFQMYACGMGTFKIAKQLEKEGIPAKRCKTGWSNTVILRLLRNEKYVGDLTTGKTYTPDPLDHGKKYNRGNSHVVKIKDHHPNEAIVDRELWDKVQKMLEENTTSAESKSKLSNRYWCSGKIRCGECGERYVSRKKNQKCGVQYKAWVCWSSQQRGVKKELVLDTGETVMVGCNSHSVNERVILQGMKDIITEFIKPNFLGIKAELDATYQDHIQSSSEKAKKRLAEIEKLMEAKKQTKVNLAIKNAQGILDDDVYIASAKVIDAEIAELHQEQHDLSIVNTSSAEAIAELSQKMDVLNKILELQDDNFNEAIYRSILDRIEVFNGNVLKFYFKFLSKPIILQYKSVGRLEKNRIEFTVLSDVEFEGIRSSNG